MGKGAKRRHGMNHAHQKFLPAAGRDLFLPLYDPLTVLFGFARIRRGLLTRARLQPRERVLDVGCGTGTLLVALGKAYPDVSAVGLDPDPNALARAARKLRRAGLDARLLQGFAHALALDANSFDCVLSSFMFHHLDVSNQQAMLSEAHRVLAPGGRLELLDFVSEPARAHGLFARFKPTHAGLAEQDVIASMKRAGFAD